jgi:hypothetical protein
MTGEASPDQPKEEPDLARFLQDWTALWHEELRAQANDPEAMAGAMELWRAAMTAWTGGLGFPPAAASRDPTAGASRPQAAAAAPVDGDGEVERVARGELEQLARRVEELEARLAKLETAPRRRR